MLLSKQLLRFARFAYHRTPVPLHIKWRVRDALGPFLKALSESQTGTQFLRKLLVLRHAYRAENRHTDQASESVVSVIKVMAEHCRLHGPMTHVIVLPFLSSGGAEQAAIQFAKVIGQQSPSASVGLVITDKSLVSTRLKIPAHVLVLDLLTLMPTGLGRDAKIIFLRDWLLAVRPRVVHIINSDLAWQLIAREGGTLSKVMRIFGSIFAMQFSGVEKKRVGYAEYYLRDSICHLQCLLSDNKRFLADAISAYGLGEAAEKMLTVYHACRIAEGNWLEQARKRIHLAATNPSKRLRVLWAGRLDAEKRIDLLLDVVNLCRQYDFYVFGENVVGEMPALPAEPNFFYCGPFSDPQEIVDGKSYDVFLFTSKWEGMPNILLEIGALGIPIVAVDVGGVRELIGETTGYLIPANAKAKDYGEVLRSVDQGRAEALARASRLLDVLQEHHTNEAFTRALLRVPGYLHMQ